MCSTSGRESYAVNRHNEQDSARPSVVVLSAQASRQVAGSVFADRLGLTIAGRIATRLTLVSTSIGV